jgi:hypothetical protein
MQKIKAPFYNANGVRIVDARYSPQARREVRHMVKQNNLTKHPCHVYPYNVKPGHWLNAKVVLPYRTLKSLNQRQKRKRARQ